MIRNSDGKVYTVLNDHLVDDKCITIRWVTEEGEELFTEWSLDSSLRALNQYQSWEVVP